MAFAPAKGYPAGDSPGDVAAGDLDGDGDSDLAISNGAIDKVSVLIRRSDGTFGTPRKYAAGDGPGQVVVGDLNGDGDQDLAMTGTESHTIEVYKNRGDGTFEYSGSYYLNTEEDGRTAANTRPAALPRRTSTGTGTWPPPSPNSTK